MTRRHYYRIHKTIPYGSMYWIERQADADWFRKDLSAIRQMGMNTIRTFVFNPEIAPNSCDYAQLDALFDAAADVGLTICPALTHQLPAWRAKAMGYDPRLNVPVPYLLDDPRYCAQLEPMLTDLVARFAGHPALWSWILWNEPSRANTMPPPPQRGGCSRHGSRADIRTILPR